MIFCFCHVGSDKPLTIEAHSFLHLSRTGGSMWFHHILFLKKGQRKEKGKKYWTWSKQDKMFTFGDLGIMDLLPVPFLKFELVHSLENKVNVNKSHYYGGAQISLLPWSAHKIGLNIQKQNCRSSPRCLPRNDCLWVGRPESIICLLYDDKLI